MKKILFRKILLDCATFFLISLVATSIIIWIFQAVNYLDIMIEDGLIVPSTQEMSRSLIRTSDINFFESYVKQKKFNDTIKGITIYAENKDKDGNLENIYLEKDSDTEDFQITYAKKGVFKYSNNFQTLVLYDGQTISSVNNNVNNFSFSKSDFNLSQYETRVITVIKTQETSSKDLFNCIRVIYKEKNINILKNKYFFRNCNLSNISNVFRELYKRFIIPLYLPLLILIALLLVTTSKENTRYTNYKIIIFLIGFSVIIFSETTLRFVEDTYIENLKLLTIPLISLFSLYFIFYYKLVLKLK